MEVTARMEASCTPERLFGVVADLGTYPQWLGIVTRVQPETSATATGAPAAPPAWLVDLRARVGPLARSKRLRMVRTEHLDGRRVRFERLELDGRSHSPWVLEAEVSAVDEGSRLEMRLRYDGRFGGPLLERLLDDEIEQSRPRLASLLATAPS